MSRYLVLCYSVLLSACISAEPQTFACKADLGAHTYSYSDPPQFDFIRRDACQGDYGEHSPACSSGELNTARAQASADAVEAEEKSAIDKAIDDLILPLDDEQKAAVVSLADAINGPLPVVGDTSPSVLLLSGGGGWGAFGAGFLPTWRNDPQAPTTARPRIPDFNVVTGISTGAIQGLFVAAGDYGGLQRAYDISSQDELATRNSIRGLLRKGSQFDTSPLRQLMMSTLCSGSGDDCPMLDQLKQSDTTLLIGMVEAQSGQLKIVDISAFLEIEYGKRAHPKSHLAECVSAVTMASAAVPVQLSPVQIMEGDELRTYVDGGVRYSVFLDYLARGARLVQLSNAKNDRSDIAPNIYVVRNGPTVVPPDDGLRAGNARAAVDEQPDALQVGKRSYATIVNQNEVASIAMLRLIYPDQPIRLVTADGYNSLKKDRCGHAGNGMVFDPDFMSCLIDWGVEKYKPPGARPNQDSPWIEIHPIKIEPPE